MDFIVNCFDNAMDDSMFGDFKDMVVDASNIFSLVMDFKQSRTLNILLIGNEIKNQDFLQKINASEDGVVYLDSTKIHFVTSETDRHLDAVVCFYATYYLLNNFKNIKPYLHGLTTYFVGSEKNLNKIIFHNNTTKHIPNKVAYLKTKEGFDELLQLLIQ